MKQSEAWNFSRNLRRFLEKFPAEVGLLDALRELEAFLQNPQPWTPETDE